MSTAPITTVIPFLYREWLTLAVAEKTENLGLFLKKHRRPHGREDSAKFTGLNVADALGFAQSYISRLENGSLEATIRKWRPERQWQLLKAYRFPDDEALELAKRFGLDIPPQQPSLSSFRTDQAVPLKRKVPVYIAGTGPAWDYDEIVDHIYLPDDFYVGTELVGLRAMSQSMENYLRKGDIAVVALDPGLCKVGDICGVWIYGDGVMIKRYAQDLGEGRLLLESLKVVNGEDRFIMAEEGSRVMGKVVSRVLYD